MKENNNWPDPARPGVPVIENQWRTAIYDALTEWHDPPRDGETPKAALRRLVHTEILAVLDPAVSRPAADLVTQARRDALIGPLSDIANERQRQQQEEGWTVRHDDMHTHGELARAAACYALHTTAAGDPSPSEIVFVCNQYWPWDYHWWKPRDARRDLIRAAALILAEIERLDRAAAIRALKGEAND